MEDIRGNYGRVLDSIKETCIKCGRDPESVLLCAVTKTHSPQEINEAIAAGATDIGENKVQEITEKYQDVQPVKWHMIGHLQTNKVKYIIDKVCLIHSVDSFRLAEEIDKRAAACRLSMDILIEVNAAGEETKSGITIQETEPLMMEILEKCPNIRIRGLMTVAPAAEDPEDVRMYFRDMKQLYDRLSLIKHERADFKWLSMGMSHDYKAAIEEGANIVRVGTAIFGARNYDIKL